VYQVASRNLGPGAVFQNKRQYISPPPGGEPHLYNVMKEPMELKELKAQVAELQAQAAFQDDTIAALDEAIAAQQQEILLLRRQVELLKQRQDEIAAGQEEGGADAAAEKPPHY